MTSDQINEIINRITKVENRIKDIETGMLTKSDVIQAVLIVHAFTVLVICGFIIVLQMTGALG